MAKPTSATTAPSDVRFEMEGNPEPQSAVQVTLEHREGYCVDVIAHYTRRDDGLEFDQLMASPRSGRVFVGCHPLSTPMGDARDDIVES